MHATPVCQSLFMYKTNHITRRDTCIWIETCMCDLPRGVTNTPVTVGTFPSPTLATPSSALSVHIHLSIIHMVYIHYTNVCAYNVYTYHVHKYKNAPSSAQSLHMCILHIWCIYITVMYKHIMYIHIMCMNTKMRHLLYSIYTCIYIYIYIYRRLLF